MALMLSPELQRTMVGLGRISATGSPADSAADCATRRGATVNSYPPEDNIGQLRNRILHEAGKQHMMLKPAALFALPLILFAAAAQAQQDPFVGTWEENVAKSKYDPGPPPAQGATISPL